MAQNYWDISCPTSYTYNALDRWLVKESIIPHTLRATLLANNNGDFPLEIRDSFLDLSDDQNEDMFCLENKLRLLFDPTRHKIVKILTFKTNRYVLSACLYRMESQETQEVDS